MSLEKVEILGVSFVKATKSQFVQQLDKHLANQEKAFVVTANPEIVMMSVEDDQYKQLIDKATYITADGIGVVKAAQLLNKPLPERVTGYDTMLDLLSLSEQNGYSIYMLGGQQETIDKAVTNLKQSYPNLRISGYHNGYFDWNDSSIVEEIKMKEPDLIFVALGVPRQEQWISVHLPSLTKGVCIGVGGSFDVIAGTVQRAPLVWQKANLEWLYRLLKQPSRWKRMLAIPRFAMKILKVKMSKSYE